MWRCVCGHAFYSSLPRSCPSCDRIVDADDEETVTVDGRRLPFHVWEAEVLVRAAGWASLLRGGALIASAIPAATFASGPTATVAGAVGLLLVASGVATFRRSWVSRWTLVVQSVFVVPLAFCMGAATGLVESNRADPVVTVSAAAAELVVDVFTLYVTASRSGDWVWEMGAHGEPIARLSSVWTENRSIKAWAFVGMVCLSGLVALIFAWLVSTHALLKA